MSAEFLKAWASGTLLIIFFILPSHVMAAVDIEEILPPVSCGAGWKIAGTPLIYDRETLSDRINGEAELYFPYGFDRMAAARYVSEKSAGSGIDVEIYRMGSLLDAFGMYANYRQKNGRTLGAGAESNLSGSQLFLYQGLYFVHIQTTGAETAKNDSLAECAKTVAPRLPGTVDRPRELALFKRPEIVKGSERYLPQSLLGYDFLNRGIMADASVEGTFLQVFLLLGGAANSSSTTLERFRSQLTQVNLEEKSGKILLEGRDPLYGPVMVLRSGACIAGAIKFSAKKGIRDLLDNICANSNIR